MKLTDKQPVSTEDVIGDCEREIRNQLQWARLHFDNARKWFNRLDADPEAKQELWFRFNATERRLMKDTEGKEWS